MIYILYFHENAPDTLLTYDASVARNKSVVHCITNLAVRPTCLLGNGSYETVVVLAQPSKSYLIHFRVL